MKNLKTILFGLAVLSMAACTRENMETPAHDNQNLVEVTIEAGIDNGQQKPAAAVASKVVFNDTGTGLEMNWRESGEAFDIIIGSGGGKYTMTQESSPVGGKAVFSGKLPSEADATTGSFRAGTTIALYPTTPSSTTVTSHLVDLSSQNGKYNEKNTHMYFKYSSNYVTFINNIETSNITFKYLVSILKVELDFGAEAGMAEDITFYATDLINSSKFAPNTGTWTTAGQVVGNPVTFTEDVELVNGKATVYLYLIPGTVTDLSVKATVNHKEYNAVVKAGPRIIDAGKQYNISNVKMETDDAEITSLTILPQTTGYSYDGMKMEIGRFGETAALATMDVVDGRAVVPGNITLNAGDKVWICIPKVAKFFHTLTADELSANIINLPEKNNGSTLLAEPTVDGKPYKNDWVVALYMGVDSDLNPGQPLYWATGNLIAIKTNSEIDGTTPSSVEFFIANEAITIGEGANPNPYFLLPKNAADGFNEQPAGTMWDLFQPAATTGVRTVANNNHVSSWSSADYQYAGKEGVDICRKQLGGEWRLPTYPQFKGECEKFDTQKAASNSPKYSEYTYNVPETIIVNKMKMPWTGMYLNASTGSARTVRQVYVTGNLSSVSNAYYLDSGASITLAVSSMAAVRPVTE